MLLEEALLAGVPALILDPKGDMGNLLLAFPDLAPADFRPWVNEDDARTAGMTLDDFAAKTAADWKAGLESHGIGPDRIKALREAAEATIYTPGSEAGVPLNVVGSLQAPPLSWETESEALRDEIEGAVMSVLGLIGIEADPLASREFVLLSNLIENERETVVDFDDRDFGATAPDPAHYVFPTVPIDEASFFRNAERDIGRRLATRQALELHRNSKLKLTSRPGETLEQFAQRCDEAAQIAADAETAKIRDRLEARQDRLEAALAQAQRRVEELSMDERARETNELAAGAGAILGALFGGRRRARSIAGALGGVASRRGTASRAAERRKTAEGKVAQVQDELQEVEQQILDEVQEIDAKWRAVAATTDTIAIRPEAADVGVERLTLVWVPQP